MGPGRQELHRHPQGAGRVRLGPKLGLPGNPSSLLPVRRMGFVLLAQSMQALISRWKPWCCSKVPQLHQAVVLRFSNTYRVKPKGVCG